MRSHSEGSLTNSGGSSGNNSKVLGNARDTVVLDADVAAALDAKVARIAPGHVLVLLDEVPVEDLELEPGVLPPGRWGLRRGSDAAIASLYVYRTFGYHTSTAQRTDMPDNFDVATGMRTPRNHSLVIFPQQQARLGCGNE